MPYDIYEPRFMVEALAQLHTPRRFLTDTFFRNTVTHVTKTVELDIYKGKRRVAAYVSPLHEGKVVEREGWETVDVKPAYIKEKTPLRVQDVMSRSFGENIYSPTTPEQRMVQMIASDMAMLEERILRREELMASQALIDGKVIVRGEGLDHLVDYGYESGKHKKTLSGTSCWDNGGDPMRDIDDWRREIVQRCGIPATHCITGSKVAWAIINNEEVAKRLDNRRYVMGQIAPSNQSDSISYYGDLLLPSGVVSLYSYDEWYTDPVTGDDIPLIPDDVVLIGSTNARSAFHYGLIQNMFGLSAVPRFPHSWIEDDGSARFLQLESAPMPNLYQVDAFIVARVLANP